MARKMYSEGFRRDAVELYRSSPGATVVGIVNCDNIVTVPTSALGRRLGFLLPEQEARLSAAIRAAFDLDRDVRPRWRGIGHRYHAASTLHHEGVPLRDSSTWE